MLTASERDTITAALQDWARSVPDEPLFGFLQTGRLFTPRELVEQVLEDTPDGRALLEIIEHGVGREGLNKVVDRLRHTPKAL